MPENDGDTGTANNYSNDSMCFGVMQWLSEEVGPIITKERSVIIMTTYMKSYLVREPLGSMSQEQLWEMKPGVLLDLVKNRHHIRALTSRYFLS